MKALLQRVLSASVTVNNKEVSKISNGLLVFLGVEKKDTSEKAEYLARKIANLRIFEDENQKMNLSVQDIKGQILIVSQFTLAASIANGNRPGFENAEDPKIAKELYEYFSKEFKKYNIPVQNGIFQADMKVCLINDGPVTFMLKK